MNESGENLIINQEPSPILDWKSLGCAKPRLESLHLCRRNMRRFLEGEALPWYQTVTSVCIKRPGDTIGDPDELVYRSSEGTVTTLFDSSLYHDVYKEAPEVREITGMGNVEGEVVIGVGYIDKRRLRRVLIVDPMYQGGRVIGLPEDVFTPDTVITHIAGTRSPDRRQLMVVCGRDKRYQNVEESGFRGVACVLQQKEGEAKLVTNLVEALGQTETDPTKINIITAAMSFDGNIVVLGYQNDRREPNGAIFVRKGDNYELSAKYEGMMISPVIIGERIFFISQPKGGVVNLIELSDVERVREERGRKSQQEKGGPIKITNPRTRAQFSNDYPLKLQPGPQGTVVVLTHKLELYLLTSEDYPGLTLDPKTVSVRGKGVYLGNLGELFPATGQREELRIIDFAVGALPPTDPETTPLPEGVDPYKAPFYVVARTEEDGYQIGKGTINIQLPSLSVSSESSD